MADPEAAGGALARDVLFPALFSWWAWAFAFTTKARRFFSTLRQKLG